MRVQFYPARPESKNETAIVANINNRDTQIRIGTGISIDTKYWNHKSHRAKNTPAFREGSAINTRLDKIQSEIKKCFYDYVNDNNAEPSPATFRKLIDEALGRSKEKKLNFYEYFQDFIERTKAGQRQTAKGQIISPTKYRTYRTTLNRLKEFRSNIDFDTINLDFYNDFITWLRKQGFAENYIGGHIKNLKSVLNEATEAGQNTNLAYKSKRFTKPSEEVENIALTESELLELQSLNLSEVPHLDRVRDMFLIGCYTGLRYADFSRLTPANLQSGYIEIEQSKTGKPVAIPVHSVVKSIIDKYNGNLPTAISNQKMNEYLKEVCRKVPSLCEMTTKTGTKGGMKVTANYQKWQIIGTHTGRRTFATNAYLQGVPTVTIMAVTGHKTEKAFLKYLKVTPKEHAKIMAAIWSKNKMKAI